MTRYGNNKCYRVEEVMFNMNPRQGFNKDGRNVSFADYMKT